VDLLRRGHWVFDLDGTLTVAAHDFDAIRRALDLPPSQPILEALAELPVEEARRRTTLLDEIELELARQAREAAGAEALLAALHERDARVGVLTRNSRHNALETLCATGLDRFFSADVLMGRDEATPKPSPDGILKLLERWGAPASDALIVGDYLFDLQAGRAAGVATIYVDASGAFPFAELADLRVSGLVDLLP
jgi:HAD superfamily hydrolase (TIGR01509 family)